MSSRSDEVTPVTCPDCGCVEWERTERIDEYENDFSYESCSQCGYFEPLWKG